MRNIVSAVVRAAHHVPRPLKVRIARYGVVGIVSTVVYFLLVTLLVETFRQDAVVSSVGAFAVIIVLAYVLNYRWVFASARSHSSAVLSFLLATFVSLSINAGLMHLTVNFLGWWYVLGLLLVTAIVPPINFLMNYLWCFRTPGSSS